MNDKWLFNFRVPEWLGWLLPVENEAALVERAKLTGTASQSHSYLGGMVEVETVVELDERHATPPPPRKAPPPHQPPKPPSSGLPMPRMR